MAGGSFRGVLFPLGGGRNLRRFGPILGRGCRRKGGGNQETSPGRRDPKGLPAPPPRAAVLGFPWKSRRPRAYNPLWPAPTVTSRPVATGGRHPTLHPGEVRPMTSETWPTTADLFHTFTAEIDAAGGTV